MTQTAATADSNHGQTPRLTLQPYLTWCIIGGAVVRLIVALISRGTNDAQYWHRFAVKVADVGLLQAYRADSMINHPLLMLIWARFSLLTGGDAGFAFFMKIPAMIGDLVACAILARIWLRRGDTRRARLAIAAIAFNPLAILISAYHCNTDSAFAMLSLLSMYCIAEGKGFFKAGLALGAAINVKLVPLLLIPAAASYCKNRKELLALVKGLALWVIPFLPLLFVIDAVYHNMVAYMPQHERWGVALFLYQLYIQPGWKAFAGRAMDVYSIIGRGLIIVGTLWFAAANLRCRLIKPNDQVQENPIDESSRVGTKVPVLNYGRMKRRGWNPYELGLLTYATFLVLAPGFGVQYMIMLLPLMVAISIGWAWAYSAMAGTFLILVYYMSLVPNQFPLMSFFVGPVLPMPGPLFGLVAWVILWALVVKLGRRGWGASAIS